MLDSASGAVSEGPVVQVPADGLRIQFTSLCYLDCQPDPKLGKGNGKEGNGRVTRVADVPERVRGSQIYVEVARSEDSQRSPMYLSHYFSSALKRN